MDEKKLHILTLGCQMNVYDSGQIARILEPLGYGETPDAGKADLILVNTCAIREKADQKVFSLLGRLARHKKARPEMLIAVGGCVAQAQGEDIFKRMPHVDVVFGTHALSRLPALIQKAEQENTRVVDTKMGKAQVFVEPPRTSRAKAELTSFVTIMQGCDNFCTYCVVPHVRGRETSRNKESIIREIKGLVANGTREVTLLGQNVNSYGKKEGFPSFAKLLEHIHEIQGLSRIRFTTSHPRDLSQDLIDAFGSLERLCPHIHLPVQSGSDRILKKMNRGYTRDFYLAQVDKLRGARPGIALTTDLITGFPGETEKDFEQTLELVNLAAFDGAFVFKYSDRPFAPAAKFPDKVEEHIKTQRLEILLEACGRQTLAKHEALKGAKVSVLVEGTSKKTSREWSGRTIHNRIVNFPAPNRSGLEGTFVDVVIEKAMAHSLWGRVPDSQPGKKTATEVSHAA